MRTTRKNLKWVLPLFFFAALLINACKKDYFDEGALAIKPKDFLSSANYDRMEVQIAYVNGHPPTTAAMNHMLHMLQARCNKPAGINITYKAVNSPRRSSFTENDLRDFEKSERDVFTRKNKLGVYVFFADAPYGTSGVLGIAYGPTSIAIFESEVERYSGGISQPERNVLEATVIEHEFGHLFGLVDYGTSMKNSHEDLAHPGHCDKNSCLMYYSVETSDIVGNLLGGNIPDFDSHCLEDLQANGGR